MRGVLVMFDAYDINAHYGFMDIVQGEYDIYLNNLCYAIVIESLVVEG